MNREPHTQAPRPYKAPVVDILPALYISVKWAEVDEKLEHKYNSDTVQPTNLALSVEEQNGRLWSSQGNHR
jgi:hypothetical protein